MKTILVSLLLFGLRAQANTLYTAYQCFDSQNVMRAQVLLDEAGTYYAKRNGGPAIPLVVSDGLYQNRGVSFTGSALRLGREAFGCAVLQRYGGFERNERTWAF